MLAKRNAELWNNTSRQWQVHIDTSIQGLFPFVQLRRHPRIQIISMVKEHFIDSVQFSYSVVSNSATPWIAARQASLSITNSWSSLKLISIKLVMPASHLIVCRPLLLLPQIPPSMSLVLNYTISKSDLDMNHLFSISAKHANIVSSLYSFLLYLPVTILIRLGGGLSLSGVFIKLPPRSPTI